MSADQLQGAPPRADALIGQVIAGKYEVQRILGKGAMGVVFLGRHTAMDSLVAVKLLHANVGAGQNAAERFVNEAKACSRLRHPNTIRVMDFGQMKGGQLYLVMELLQGAELKEVMQRDGPLEPARAIAITRQIAQSLDEAHEIGLVHRDLKPANVYLTKMHRRDDFVKVIDFGISKVISADEEGTDLTQMGTVLGTPLYMSPEQIHGEPLDRRSDLYALGVMLYQMLSGQTPFRGKTTTALLFAHAKDPPPPLPAVVAGRPIPLALRELVENLLAKKREHRLQSAAELDEILESFETALRRGEEPVFEQATVALSVKKPSAVLTATGEAEKTSNVFPVPVSGASKDQVSVTEAATMALEPGTEPGGALDTAARSGAEATGGVEAGRGRLPWFIGGGVGLVAAIITVVVLATGGGPTPEGPPVAGGAGEAPVASAPAPPAAGDPEPPPAPEPAVEPPVETPAVVAAPAPSEPVVPRPVAPPPTVKPRRPSPGEVVRPEGTHGSEMAFVPGGTFAMGSGEALIATQIAHCAELAGRPVCTAETFARQVPPRRLRVPSLLVDRLEASNADYRACVEAGACQPIDFGSCGTLGKSGAFSPDPQMAEDAVSADELPVSCVTRPEAAAFCAWSGKRLPSESEWEHVASSAGTRLYPWGDTLDAAGSRYNGADRSLRKAMGRGLRFLTLDDDDGHPFAAPVGQYPTGLSEHGILDLAGNVAEWTAGDYDAYSGAALPAEELGKGVARGGSWADVGPLAGTRARRPLAPETRRTDLGLRCVRDSKP